MRKEKEIKMDVETKNVVKDLINKFVEFININVIPDVLKEEITKHYDKGLEEVGLKLDMNFTRDLEKVDFLEKYTFDNIKGMNDEIEEKLRKELSQSLMNLESVGEMKKRVEKVMDVAADRASMIARTEMNRAENIGSLDAARQSGLKLMKRWDAHLDKRTSQVCHDLDGKTIPLDAKFKWNGQEFDGPPAHPNCRSTLLYIQKKEKNINDLNIETKAKYISKEGSPGNYHSYKYPSDKPKRNPIMKQIEIDSKKPVSQIVKEKISNIKPEHQKKIDKHISDYKKGIDTKSKHIKNDKWSNERMKKVHVPILKKYEKSAKLAQIKKGQKPKSIHLAGIPASGKSTAISNRFTKVDGHDGRVLKDNEDNHYLVLNADDIKKELPEYDNGIGSTHVHNESSNLTSLIFGLFADGKYNIIIDGTMGKTDKAKKQIEGLKTNGYETSLIFVDTPVHVALNFAESRYLNTGRYVPYELIPNFHTNVKKSVKELSQHFDNLEILKYGVKK